MVQWSIHIRKLCDVILCDISLNCDTHIEVVYTFIYCYIHVHYWKVFFSMNLFNVASTKNISMCSHFNVGKLNFMLRVFMIWMLLIYCSSKALWYNVYIFKVYMINLMDAQTSSSIIFKPASCHFLWNNFLFELHISLPQNVDMFLWIVNRLLRPYI